jgi:outer membrane lipoprotein-sorting protein
MKKYAIALIPVLIVILTLVLIGCGGKGQEATPTPTAAPTPTPAISPSKTPTPTSTSGKTLADIYGKGASIGDVTYDMIVTTPGQQQQTTKVYMKDAWLSDKMKFRYEVFALGATLVSLTDFASRTYYTYWSPPASMCTKGDFAQAPKDPTENGEQIHPNYLGTDTIDGKLCEVYQWTYQDTTTKAWLWKEHPLTIKMEMTAQGVTTTIEYKNIVFGTLSSDLFQPPPVCSP